MKVKFLILKAYRILANENNSELRFDISGKDRLVTNLFIESNWSFYVLVFRINLLLKTTLKGLQSLNQA